MNDEQRERERQQQRAWQVDYRAFNGFWLNVKRKYQHVRYSLPGRTDIEYMLQSDIDAINHPPLIQDPQHVGEYVPSPIRQRRVRSQAVVLWNARHQRNMRGYAVTVHKLRRRMKCPHCLADMWPEEYVERDRRTHARLFSTCCQKGAVDIPRLENTPPTMLYLTLSKYTRTYVS